LSLALGDSKAQPQHILTFCIGTAFFAIVSKSTMQGKREKRKKGKREKAIDDTFQRGPALFFQKPMLTIQPNLYLSCLGFLFNSSVFHFCSLQSLQNP